MMRGPAPRYLSQISEVTLRPAVTDGDVHDRKLVLLVTVRENPVAVSSTAQSVTLKNCYYRCLLLLLRFWT